MKADAMNRVRGRWAPTPSGLLHVGSARTALVTWLSVRAQGGTLVWRLEDLDPPRTVPGTAEAALEDLAWLGLDWDEGPDRGGAHGPYCQSERGAVYEAALAHLAAAGRLFPCRRSRKDLQELAVAPHDLPPPESEGVRELAADGTPYPAAWRPQDLPADWYRPFADPTNRSPTRPRRRDAALRFVVEEGEVVFDDAVYGPCRQNVARQVGDVVLKRRDGLYAYQLAVVVDDLAMGISEVVRGVDLLASTPRQIQLIEALGGQVPRYAHLPLVLNREGEKLSKRDGALTLRALRAAGVRPEALVGYLAHSLGLRERPRALSPKELLEGFSFERIVRQDWRLPGDLAGELR